MTDKLGRLWIVSISVLLVGLIIYLWWAGVSLAEPSQETYLTAEAARRLACKPYLLHPGIVLDANENGAKEYFFSCDSSLNVPHQRFIWMEVYDKEVRVLLWHDSSGWRVGHGPSQASSYSWLIDREHRRLFALPLRGDTFAELLEVIWDHQRQTLLLGEPLD
ncbi:MAG: hypothetical protein RMK19_00860 [Bacteroidia bacterium]|nr:hypothetical protein [Bacteroidia bacterium]MDW8014543.1 hypothetical protein [Bacteroidia bacterium]